MTVRTDPPTARMSSQLRRACRAANGPRAPWPPAAGLSDHRLVFLAAKPALRVLSQSRFGLLLSIFERGAPNTTRGGASRGMVGRDMHAEGRSENMQALVVACDEAAERMTPAELAQVRASGRLPGWFVPAVDTDARELRRQWRRA